MRNAPETVSDPGQKTSAAPPLISVARAMDASELRLLQRLREQDTLPGQPDPTQDPVGSALWLLQLQTAELTVLQTMFGLSPVPLLVQALQLRGLGIGKPEAAQIIADTMRARLRNSEQLQAAIWSIQNGGAPDRG